MVEACPVPRCQSKVIEPEPHSKCTFAPSGKSLYGDTEERRHRLKNKLHISVVDDDRSVREALENFISSAGYKVDLFESAEDFLESAEISNTACLVLDLRMPGMSGLELQYKLRDKGRIIPIIIVTAHGEDSARTSPHGGRGGFSKQAVSGRSAASRYQLGDREKLRSGEPQVERKDKSGVLRTCSAAE